MKTSSDKTVRTPGGFLAGGLVLALALATSVVGCALASDSRSEGRAPAPTAARDDQEDTTDDVPGDDAFAKPPKGTGPLRTATLAGPAGPVSLKYQMVGKEGLAEGDIIVPTDVLSATSIGRHWPNGIVPYVIDAGLPSNDRVTKAIAHWEEKTKLHLVPRTKERDYIHFRAGSGCSSAIGQQGGRQFVNLNTSEGAYSTVAIGIDRKASPERVYFFYKRGYATAGTVTSTDRYASHFRFILAPGKSVSDLVDVAFANNGHLFAFYNDGTVSEGTSEDFTFYGPAKPYTLPEGKTAADVAGFAIDKTDRVHAYYVDGTFSVGTTENLGSLAAPAPFTVAAGKTPADLAHVDLGGDGNFYAWYNDMVPNADSGVPEVRGLSNSSGTAQALASNTTAPGKVGFSSYCSTGATIHEIGHAVGLFHEQTRHDRDQFVKIQFENVEADSRFNFEKHSKVVGTDTGAYDFGSIMHYGPKAFSANGMETIVRVDGQPFTEQREGLSDGDLAGLAAMYGL